MTSENASGDVAEPQEARELREHLQATANLDIDRDLVRATDLGAASFRDYKPLFERIIAYAKRLLTLDWSLLPTTQVTQVRDHLAQLRAALQQVQAFSLQDQAQPIPTRDGYATNVANYFEALRSLAIPFIGFLSWEAVNLEEMSQRIDGLVKEASDRVQETVQELEGRRAEADRALEAIRQVAASAGVESHAPVFHNAANRHEVWSWKWLAASIAAAAATVGAAVGLVVWWDVNGDISEASNLQIVLAKGTILLVGFFVTANLLRIFRAQSHLAVVNRHREHALTTFRSFVEATEDQQVRDKVLLEATHAIFGHAATGLIDERGGQELEILDAVGGAILRRS